MLSNAAKAVMPVIASHCNEDGECFPGEERIAALAGITEMTARRGINELTGFPGFRFERYRTKRGRTGKRFKMVLGKKDEECFSLRGGIIDGGYWRMIGPTAKALYPVMRSFSYFDINEYAEDMEAGLIDGDLVSGEYVLPDEFNEIFKERIYENCEAEKGVLAEHAGITVRSVYNAIDELRKKLLIMDCDKTHDGDWRQRVYIEPKKLWRMEYLNKGLIKQYGSRKKSVEEMPF